MTSLRAPRSERRSTLFASGSVSETQRRPYTEDGDMKLSMLAFAIVAACVGAAAAVAQDAAPNAPAPAPETPVEKQSYALGAALGGQLRKNSVELDVEPFIQ